MATGRRLREDERDLITAMLGGKPSHPEFVSSLDARTGEDMQDGGMRTIRFVSCDEGRHLGEPLRRRNTQMRTAYSSASF
jgi:hypothetical protein